MRRFTRLARTAKQKDVLGETNLQKKSSQEISCEDKTFFKINVAKRQTNRRIF